MELDPHVERKEMLMKTKLNGIYQDAYKRIGKQIDRTPLNSYSAHDAYDELHDYLYDLEKNQKELEQDDVIIKRILKNKLYQSTSEHVLLWFLCPLITFSIQLFIQLPFLSTRVDSSILYSSLFLGLLSNVIIFERSYLNNKTYYIAILSLLIISIITTLLLPTFTIKLNTPIAIVIIVVCIAISILITRVVKQNYIKSKKK